ncbi:MAG: DUF2914 domain-containing protein [Desulfobulbaceae bacterium]|nr:DUF2914 domain-containing protein [Desulfobulbaceae bacterium]
MRKISYLLMALAMLATVGFTTLTTNASADETVADFTIARMVVCTDVINKEPVLGSEETFALSLGKVYCFLEAREIKKDTDITIVWIHEGATKATIPLHIKKGWRWRTYSSKKLGNMSGNWMVEIHDANGTMLDSINFVVK